MPLHSEWQRCVGARYRRYALYKAFPALEPFGVARAEHLVWLRRSHRLSSNQTWREREPQELWHHGDHRQAFVEFLTAQKSKLPRPEHSSSTECRMPASPEGKR